jgi:hypothetical protein
VPPSDPLLPLRTAVNLFLAFDDGVLAAVLTYLGNLSLPDADLIGGAAFGSAVPFFNKIIGH